MRFFVFSNTPAACFSVLALAACGSGDASSQTSQPVGGGGGVPDAGAQTSGGGTKDAGAPPKGPASTPPAEAGPAAPPAGGYTVSGATVLDAAGNPHLFRGLARPSLEWSSMGDSLGEGDYGVMSAWGANVVRIPLNQDFWLQSDANGASNPNYDSSYADTVDQQVKWAEAAKPKPLDVILDLHWSDKGDFNTESQCKSGPSGCQQVMADAHSVLFWQQVAAKYKNDPHVLFELYNEPNLGGYQPQANNWTAWLNGDTTNAYGFTVVGMQKLYDTVRATGANNLVVIGGLGWSFDLSGVTSHAVNGTNILYATHPYQTDSQGMWTASFGSLSAKYPIIATEFGDRSASCTPSYASNFMAYANKKAANGDNPSNELSWTAWAFYAPSSPAQQCTFPTLLMDWYTPNAVGNAVQAALMAGP